MYVINGFINANNTCEWILKIYVFMGLETHALLFRLTNCKITAYNIQ
jgi:hypothetical protein